MAVSMNSIGNYSAYNFNTSKAGKSLSKNNASFNPEGINNEEKKVFCRDVPSKAE